LLRLLAAPPVAKKPVVEELGVRGGGKRHQKRKRG
jgi:hypothetical protein